MSMIPEDPVYTINSYSPAEGCPWIVWPNDQRIYHSDLEAMIGPKYQHFAGIQFHALKMDSGNEWDTVNGWRHTIDDPDFYLRPGSIISSQSFEDGFNEKLDSLIPNCRPTYPTPPTTSPALAQQVGGSHYKHMTIQPIEFFIANSIPYAEAAVCKYAIRHREKGGAEDLKKAIHILQILLEKEYPNE